MHKAEIVSSKPVGARSTPGISIPLAQVEGVRNSFSGKEDKELSCSPPPSLTLSSPPPWFIFYISQALPIVSKDQPDTGYGSNEESSESNEEGSKSNEEGSEYIFDLDLDDFEG